jgi:hypothetical protein
VTFWSAFAFVLLRDTAGILVLVFVVDLIDRYRSGEPMPFWGEK